MDKKEFFTKGKITGNYYRIAEGTGDNLLCEDVEQGYIDYIYYDIYETILDVYRDDTCGGGQYLLKEYYQDLTLEQIIEKIAKEEGEEMEVIE